MRVLITGGFGLIGGRLAYYLQGQGYEITLGSRENRLAPAWLWSGKTARIDYSDRESIKSACKDVDILIHAGGSNASQFSKTPSISLHAKKIESEELLHAIKDTHLKKILYISSAHIYANPLIGAISENSIIGSNHPYAVSHQIGEKAILEARSDVLILRLANAFGYPMNSDANCWMLLANDLCKQSLRTGKMKLLTDGQQERNFIAMSEVCRIIGIIISHNSLTENIFNLGSEKSMTVMQMAKLIQMRAKMVLNLEISIEHLASKEINVLENLDFKSTALARNGILVDSSLERELDKLLIYCAKKFS